MPAGDYFPATRWVWRQLTSRFARKLLLAAILLLLLISIGLRIQAAIWQYRVTSLLHRLEAIRVHQTTKSEVLSALPGLQPKATDCPEQTECFAVRVNIWPEVSGRFFGEFFSPSNDDSVLRRMLGSLQSYRLVNWLGFRFGLCHVVVHIRRGKVAHLNYWLAMASPHHFRTATSFGAGTTDRAPSGWSPDPALDDTPDYGVRDSGFYDRASRGLLLDVAFTPAAPEDLVRHAFDARLNCIWQMGCHGISQILPDTWKDIERIQRLPLVRLASNDPCPNRILKRRVRDINDIFLVEITDITNVPESDPNARHLKTGYHVLRVLRGTAKYMGNSGTHPARTLVPGVGRVPNPALRWLRQGEQALFFWDYRGIAESFPCAVMRATPEAVQIIETELARAAAHRVE